MGSNAGTPDYILPYLERHAVTDTDHDTPG